MIAGKYSNELVFGNKPEDIEGYEDAITSDEMYVPHHVLEYKYTIDELVSLNRYDKVSADELIWMTQSVHNGNPTLHKSVRLYNEAKKGRTLSEEHRKKISESEKGEKNHNYGKHLSEETKQKLSEAKKNISDETRKNISESLKGRTLSEEHRKKISEARKGRTFSEETKRKISESNKGDKHHNYGKHLSEETRRKISEARKAYLRTRNQQV